MTPKPFYKKSETYLTAAYLLCVGLTAILKDGFVVAHPAVFAIVSFATGIVTSAYTLGRSLIYANQPAQPSFSAQVPVTEIQG